MKRKTLLLTIVATLLCPVAFAQNISQHVYGQNASNGDHTLVRSWDSDHIVTFYVEGEKPILEVLEISTNNIRRAELQGLYYFRDMIIDNGFLYFCGSTSYYYTGYIVGDGIIGRVDLASFYAPTNLLDLIFITRTDLTTVNKLVEFDDGGVSHIVAIGEEIYASAPYTYSQYYYVDCKDIESTTPTVIVEKFTVEERYDDVLLTDNYVVFMGYYRDILSPSICYRKALRTNLYTIMFDDIHLFYNGADALSVTHSTSLENDCIATSYMSTNQASDFVTRIRILDINIDQNINSQDFVVPDRAEPHDLTYIPADKSVVLMEDFTLASDYHTNFIFVEPNTYSQYLTDIEYRISEIFQSITLHNYSYYLAGKGSIWFFRLKTIAPTNFPNMNCPDIIQIKIDIVNNLISYKIINQILWSSIIDISYPYNYLISSSTATIDCLNY